MSRDNSYRGIPDMHANNGWTFGAGLANGVNFRNHFLKEAEAARNRKMFEQNRSEALKNHNATSNNTATPTGVVAQGRTDVYFPQIPYDVTQMNQMPVDGGNWFRNNPENYWEKIFSTLG